MCLQSEYARANSEVNPPQHEAAQPVAVLSRAFVMDDPAPNGTPQRTRWRRLSRKVPSWLKISAGTVALDQVTDATDVVRDYATVRLGAAVAFVVEHAVAPVAAPGVQKPRRIGVN